MDEDKHVRRCEWCGVVFRQERTGRTRLYCTPSHRTLAWHERRTQARVAAALEASKAESRTVKDDARSVVDETPRPAVETDAVAEEGMSDAAFEALSSAMWAAKRGRHRRPRRT